jgi:RNA polymerase-binding transcription factor DksA
MENYFKIKERLLERKEKLDELLIRVERSARRQLDKSYEEQAIQRENEEALTVLDNSLNDELKQIEKALTRIEKGKYGICENCGETIPVKRLETLPHAALCINCAS